MPLKMITLVALTILSTQAANASNPQPIIGVTICAASCNNESLNIKGHNEAIVGKIYYAPATDENKENTAVCLSESKSVKVVSNRLSDFSFNACLKALSGKYYGKTVIINPNDYNDGEDGVFLSIKEIK